MKYFRLILALLLCISCSNVSPLEGRYPSGGKQDDEKPVTPPDEDTPTTDPTTGTYKILFIGNRNDP